MNYRTTFIAELLLKGGASIYAQTNELHNKRAISQPLIYYAELIVGQCCNLAL
ncbi:MAG TPA: hypothetical protein PKD74_02670 [Candidatus Dependentiae bacterium]|nr:hypothetical protein [Candidatus Dependentiae bacterium]